MSDPVNGAEDEFWDVTSLFLQGIFFCSLSLFMVCYLFVASNIFVLLGLFFVLVTAGGFICYKLFGYGKDHNSNSINLSDCKKCITQLDDDSFFLRHYGLLKANSTDKKSVTLQSIEESLECGDNVIIYTPQLASEQAVLETVKSNVRKGVIYNIVYYIEHELTNDERNLYTTTTKLKEDDDSIDYSLFKCLSGFDLFCFKKKKTNKIKAYFAVNYSVRDKDDIVCENAVSNYCTPENQCHVDNDNLFYKKLDDNTAGMLYAHLSRVITNCNTKKRSTPA